MNPRKTKAIRKFADASAAFAATWPADLCKKACSAQRPSSPTPCTLPLHSNIAPPSWPRPVVVAKGQNLIAQKIKELARWNDIPIVENPPLAQALYKATDVGQMIPPKLYAAVAEILAFVFRAQMRMRGAEAKSF